MINIKENNDKKLIRIDNVIKIRLVIFWNILNKFLIGWNISVAIE